MHELSLCQGLISQVEAIALEENAAQMPASFDNMISSRGRD